MRPALIALTLVTALSTPGAALAARAGKKVHFLRPPRLEMPRYSSVGVVDIDGWAAGEMEGALVSALLDETRGLGWTEGLGPEDPVVAWPNHFPVVERQRLDLVFGEQSIGDGGLSDDQLGQLSGVMQAGVLITGRMRAPIHQDEWEADTETKEVEVTREETETEVEVDVEEDWWGDEEVTVTVTETTREVTTVEEREVVNSWCLQRNVLVSFDLRVIDVRTGRVQAAETVQASAADRACDEVRANVEESIKSVDSLAAGSITLLATRTANRVAPYWGTMKLVLERNKNTKDGVLMFTKDDDLAGAAVWMEEASKADPYDGDLHYNAGLLMAATYRFSEAREHLRAARAIKDTKILRRLERLIDDLSADYDRLVAMGLPMHPLELAMTSAAATQEVQVRGGKKKRVSIYENGGGVGSVVAEVPGGMTLTLLDERGDWAKVRTFDGKVGWIRGKDLR